MTRRVTRRETGARETRRPRETQRETGPRETRRETGAREELPEGWQAEEDEEGDTYYWNVNTKETTWDKPQHIATGGPRDLL